MAFWYKRAGFYDIFLVKPHWQGAVRTRKRSKSSFAATTQWADCFAPYFFDPKSTGNARHFPF
jgi:hypothetical protein